MTDTFIPTNAQETLDAIAWAVAEAKPLALFGHNSKQRLGRPVQTAYNLDLSRLQGVVEYEPAELVLTARPGTPLADIEALVTAQGQMLAFEPPDYGPLWGGPANRGTLGGVIGTNLAGPRRFKSGALRDHLLGFSCVTGRAEIIKAGAKVVKNVTGYDLPKLISGSFGTLAALTEVSIKVLPAPEKTRTILLYGVDDDAAIKAMAEAAASPHEVSGLAHLPKAIAKRSGVRHVSDAGAAVTLIRLEGTDISVKARCTALREQLGKHGPLEELHSLNSAWAWREIRDVSLLNQPLDRQLWRISLPPMQGAACLARIRQALPAAEAFFDWAGGLLWLALPAAQDAHADIVRGAIADCGGHATLFRASDSVRAALSVFQPQPEALAALSRRVKQSFDPNNILNPGRMEAGA